MERIYNGNELHGFMQLHNRDDNIHFFADIEVRKISIYKSNFLPWLRRFTLFEQM